MQCKIAPSRLTISLHAAIVFVSLTIFLGYIGNVGSAGAETRSPVPLLEKGHSVDWWFIFKFNSTGSFAGCSAGLQGQNSCPFGGKVQNYKSFSQQFVYASSNNKKLQKGGGCVGGTAADPLGATFDQVYNGAFYYVIWNDQFYGDPDIPGSSPWGHSKGMVAWDHTGNGFVLQVTTPSWPGSGNEKSPRKKSGNTLGCINPPNNVKFSQHFFALKLNKDDLIIVLKAMKNASVATDASDLQVVKNGGPREIQQLVLSLGERSQSTSVIHEVLSTGVTIISKPSALHVPPWQMVSAVLDSVPLRTATWWASPQIYSTAQSTKVTCWDDSLGKPGPVTIALSGQWNQEQFKLGGMANHAKIGVSTSSDTHYAIFGDMNQQGARTGTKKACKSSQNGRGGLFYVVNDKVLFDGLTNLMEGKTAPLTPPRK